MRGLELLDELGATAGVLPELEALRGVGQNPNHHLDVHGHTLEVFEQLLEVESDLDRFAGEAAAERSGAARRAARRRGHPRRTRCGSRAVLHDVGKPATRRRA